MTNQPRPAVADWIREQIKKEVRAQVRRALMARTREDFINRLVEVLSPALGHYYRTALGELNNQTDQVAKWRQQEEHFLDQFDDRILQPTKAKGLDRKEAAKKALEEIMDEDEARRRRETSKFAATYKIRKIVPLPDDAHEGFLEKVRQALDETFPGD